MIEKSDHARFIHLPDAIGMRKHAFGFIDNEIICSFFHNGNLDFWRLFKHHRRKVSFQVINGNLISGFEFCGFLGRFSVQEDSASADDMMKKIS